MFLYHIFSSVTLTTQQKYSDLGDGSVGEEEASVLPDV